MTDTKNRCSNFELLRILCIILIVAFHFVGGVSEYITYPTNVTLNLIAFYSIGLWGKTAVFCFVMITGYYTINNKFKLNKLLYLIIETEFYSIIIFVTMAYFNLITINYETLTHALFPLLFVDDYWFVTDYIILLLLSPILNKIIKSLTLKELQYLLLILIISAYYCSTITNHLEYMNPILFFILFYTLAAYIRLYPNKLTEDKKMPAIFLILCIFFGISIVSIDLTLYWNDRPLIEIKDNLWRFILLIVSTATIIMIVLKKHKMRNLTIATAIFSSLTIFAYMPSYGLEIRDIIENNNSIIVGLSAISLFLTFKNITIKHNRTINWLAGGVLGVYLIHSNRFLSQYSWQYIPSDILMHSYFIVEYLSIVILIVIICIMIDRVRISLFTIVGNNKYIIKLKNIVIDKMKIEI